MENKEWSFVAMEYYALILNRTYLITVKNGALSGVVCRGLTSLDGGDALSQMFSIKGDMTDTKSYIDPKRLNQSNSANFSIPMAGITSVRYDPRKKWGMGPIPHDGKLYVEAAGKKREFIILGKQSGKEIADRLRAGAGRK